MIKVEGRILNVPEDEKLIGVVGENKFEYREFEITDERLFGYYFVLEIQIGSYSDSIELDKALENDRVILTWNIQQIHLQIAGVLKVQIKAFESLGDNVPVWKSIINKDFIIEKGLNVTEKFIDNLPSVGKLIIRRIMDIQIDVTQKARVAAKSEENAARSERNAAQIEANMAEILQLIQKCIGIYSITTLIEGVSAEFRLNPVVPSADLNKYAIFADDENISGIKTLSSGFTSIPVVFDSERVTVKFYNADNVETLTTELVPVGNFGVMKHGILIVRS